MREHIVAEIKRLAAANGGKPPGQQAFHSQTGIGQSKWSGVYWSKWGDALAEAGYSANEWTKRHDTSELTEQFARVALTLGHIPTVRELQLLRRNGEYAVPSPRVIREHFHGQNGVVEALRELAYRISAYEQLRNLLPAAKPTASQPKATKPDGWVYLVKAGDFYKIGRSDEIERRLKEIKVALPNKAVLFHAIQTDDPSGIEAYWHRRFAHRRANGEWFKLSMTDIAAFTRRKFQ